MPSEQQWEISHIRRYLCVGRRSDQWPAGPLRAQVLTTARGWARGISRRLLFGVVRFETRMGRSLRFGAGVCPEKGEHWLKGGVAE